jgi:tetratricopeptide (TPR) repeat protein
MSLDIIGGLGACHLLLGHPNQAIELLRKARTVNPQLYSTYLWLAGALGLQGDQDGARAALAELNKMKPDLITSKDIRNHYPYYSDNPVFLALRQNTMDLGLRRAGIPDE